MAECLLQLQGGRFLGMSILPGTCTPQAPNPVPVPLRAAEDLQQARPSLRPHSAMAGYRHLPGRYTPRPRGRCVGDAPPGGSGQQGAPRSARATDVTVLPSASPCHSLVARMRASSGLGGHHGGQNAVSRRCCLSTFASNTQWPCLLRLILDISFFVTILKLYWLFVGSR